MYKNMLNYSARGIYPFHMPGHKGNAEFFPENPLSLDLTEIPGMDVLSEPSGIIKNFLEKIAEKFFAKKSFFLTNGSTTGILAAICAACTENTPVFVPRNAHVSLHNGLVFSGAKPFYFMPEIMRPVNSTGASFAADVNPEIFDQLPLNPVVFIVSPTYEGFVSDISAIAKKVHARNGLLIVDEAHGAHFSFHDYFPKSAVSQGADIVINSLHKTLPAISGCAVLHVNGNRVNLPRLQFFINAFQTTSPSYALMAACDFMLEKLWKNPDYFEKYVTRLEKFRHALATSENPLSPVNFRKKRAASDFPVLRLIGNENVNAMDMGKLFFHTSHSAEKISEIFAQEFFLQTEMARGSFILAMTSVADTDEGFERLRTAVFGINEKLHQFPTAQMPLPNQEFPQIFTQPALSPRQAVLCEHEEIPSTDAIGRISAEIIADYPPGIAIVSPGEKIAHIINKPFVRVVKP